MDAEPYLTRLTTRLLDGVERLPDDTRQRHARYLLEAQNLDGGFSGREGGSDLYYTGFALRSLAVLQALNPEVCGKAADFLKQKMTGSAAVVDFFSLVVSCYLVPLGGGPDVLADAPADWKDRVASTLETFRSPDAGYARAAGGPSGSTYTSFLVALCLQLLGKPVPQPQRLATFVKSRRRADGGYGEFSVAKRGQTNLTAAAIGVLQSLGELDAETATAAADFLTGLQSRDEGGILAHATIPCADVLSTFTGCWTLDQLGAADRVDWPAVRRYVRSCERPDGGFRGGLVDPQGDVEYTFYGL
ncbi:MAG TPA: prenyltransferase/squalene oxidase repeat-containing protein, partial [Gemmataceae bacterium]|nr:prenyltransferase/squalene oxidase repeat-containing protein [Gemmataceae bacterium]